MRLTSNTLLTPTTKPATLSKRWITPPCIARELADWMPPPASLRVALEGHLGSPNRAPRGLG
jgi:hypothetical protein